MRQSPISIKNTTPYILDNPVGIDGLVKDLQEGLPNILTWLEKSFNRATLMSKVNEGSGNIETYPVCWVDDGKDQINMVGLLDNFTAYSFWYATGNETALNYSEFDDNIYSRQLRGYFFMDLEKIDNSKTYDFTEELKMQILSAIKEVRFSTAPYNITLLQIIDEADDILDGFSVANSNNTADYTRTQSMYYPYKALRFDFNAIYSDTLIC